MVALALLLESGETVRKDLGLHPENSSLGVQLDASQREGLSWQYEHLRLSLISFSPDSPPAL